MGDTYAGGGYYCSISEHANACVRPGAALFSSWVNLAVLMAAPVPGKGVAGASSRACPLVYGGGAACSRRKVAGVVRRRTDLRVGRGSIGLLVCGGWP
jgi:hypothetical protein